MEKSFFLQIRQLVWPWALVTWQWQRQGGLRYVRALVLAAGAPLSSDWSLVPQRGAKICLTLQGTCQSPNMWDTNILMPICRFKTPRSFTRDQGREGLKSSFKAGKAGVISTELDLSWALSNGFIPGAAMKHFMVHYSHSRKQCLILKLNI